jgi:hypothetical protein
MRNKSFHPTRLLASAVRSTFFDMPSTLKVTATARGYKQSLSSSTVHTSIILRLKIAVKHTVEVYSGANVSIWWIPDHVSLLYWTIRVNWFSLATSPKGYSNSWIYRCTSKGTDVHMGRICHLPLRYNPHLWWGSSCYFSFYFLVFIDILGTIHLASKTIARQNFVLGESLRKCNPIRALNCSSDGDFLE